MSYLLDTNILSDLIHNPQGRVARRIRQVGESQVCTSIIVAVGLRYGAFKRGSSRLSERVEGVLGFIRTIDFAPPADAAYATTRARLEQADAPIRANVLLIAAQAMAPGLVVVTENPREFQRIDGLRVENWLGPDHLASS